MPTSTVLATPRAAGGLDARTCPSAGCRGRASAGAAWLAPMPPTRAARWTTRSGRCVGEQRRRRRPRSVRSNSALRGTTTSAHGAGERATTTRPRNPEPPVTRTLRPARSAHVGPGYGAASGSMGGMRVGLHARAALARRARWHRRGHPAGRPRALARWRQARSQRREDGDPTRRPGRRRRHRTTPPPGAPWTPPDRRAPAARPGRPLLYDAWLCALRRPPVERATGQVDVAPRHGLIPCRHHRAARGDGPRPRLPPRPRVASPAAGRLLFRRGLAGDPPPRRPRAVLVRGDPGRLRGRRASAPSGSVTSRSGSA